MPFYNGIGHSDAVDWLKNPGLTQLKDPALTVVRISLSVGMPNSCRSSNFPRMGCKRIASNEGKRGSRGF
ncbi:hypothetical protein K443DRAFT_681210 [Laccaria amethystina LaAM-08-1]|uniref:Uncharacterized protein n=1 Tax=Laccaria amethystina LaAM-08-1 TaxID=1095629 RepID=A0A0C9WM58_9AGAR|nr:hypothetical protein K443DRAFT_681210 [Laccaria amethystina LaAM-08-1]